jgi:hypothetical protein
LEPNGDTYRSWATIAPAHLPDLKPQQPDAQSASDVQGPVMNCVPWAEMRVARPRVRREMVKRTIFAVDDVLDYSKLYV